MKFYNALGVFTAVLSLVLLIKHGFEMGTMAAPFELAINYYEEFTNAILGWVAPLAARLCAALGWHFEFFSHWKHVFLLTFLYCGAYARAGGGEIGSALFDPIWGLIVSLGVGLAAGALPLNSEGADPADDKERQLYKVAIMRTGGAMAFITPFALADLNDGDNNHLLCLDTTDSVTSVSFPAGHLTDPREDLNPDTTLSLRKS